MTHSTIITGAAGALGSALARVLSSRGHALTLVDIPAAQPALDQLNVALGGRCVAKGFDTTSLPQWAELLTAIEAQNGAVTGATLVAGGWAGGAPVHEVKDDSAWRSMLERNTDTVWFALRALLPGMVARRNGSVVVIGSRAVERPWTSTGSAAYSASKSAAVALAQTVAAEVLEHRVRINAVMPSTIDTGANRKAMPDADPSRWVSTDSLAQVIDFLLSDASRDISGAAIPVYGRA